MDTTESGLTINTVLENQRLLSEVLREDVADLQEKLLGHKVSLRHSNAVNQKLVQEIKEEASEKQRLEQQLEAQVESTKVLQDRYQSLEWYLGTLSKQEITSEFLVEIHDMYNAHKQQLQEKANTRAVARVHLQEQQALEDKAEDKAASHNLVTRREEGIQDFDLPKDGTSETDSVEFTVVDPEKEEPQDQDQKQNKQPKRKQKV